MLFIKQLGRSPIKLTAFFLLLVLAGTLGSVGVNAYHAAAEQTRTVEGNYTTIAIPNYMPEAYSLKFNDLDNVDEDETFQANADITALVFAQEERIDRVSKAVETAMDSKYVKQYEQRELLGGFCPELTPVFNNDIDSFGIDTYTYDFTMMSITCTDVSKDGLVLFEVDEIIYESASQKVMRIASGIDEGGIAPFFKECEMLREGKEWEEGTRLLIWGTFYPSVGALLQRLYPGGSLYDSYESAKTGYPEYPIYAELPEGMSAREYIESSGEFDDVITMFEKTRSSLPVVTTDNIRSIANFAAGNTPLIYGREFTKEEYDTGANVCVISASLAVQNGLDVGDRFNMALYNCQMEASINLAGISFEPYMEGFSADTPAAEYEIVGIYSDRGFKDGLFDFNPNTVFIPAGAVKDKALITHVAAGNFMTRKPLKMESIVLKNGSIAAFEEEMAKAGYAECFLYEDQGYKEMMQAVRTMQSNATRLILFSICVFLVSIALYAFLYGINFKSTMVTMRLLGDTGKATYYSAVVSAVIFAACSFIIGGVIAKLVFADAFKLLSSSVVAQFSVPVALLTVVAEVMIAAISCMLSFRRCLRKNPLSEIKQ